LLPLQVRDMVHDFYNSRYATCFAALEALKPILAIDIHLHDHVKALLSEIKTRALVQVSQAATQVAEGVG
jgi:COP9 signalosome complex subunit 1